MESQVKKSPLTLLFLSIISLVYAVDFPGSAVGDDFLSIRINPAAMAYGNAGGIAYIQPYQLDSENGEEPELFSDFVFQLSGSSLGYYFDKQDTSFNHNILSAAEILPNTYAGFRFSWDNSDIGAPAGGLSILSRPSDYFSFAGTAEKLFTSGMYGLAGLGLRPFASLDKNPGILSLSMDFPWEDGFSEPIIGATSSLVPGVELQASYNTGTNQISAGISYSMGISRFGTIADNDTRGYAYVHLGGRNYTTPVLPVTDPYVNFNPGKIIVEEPSRGFSLFSAQNPTLYEVLKEIEELKNNPAIKGLVLKNANFQLSWAGYSELIESLNRFREEGKKIVYYFENISLQNYVLAAATGDAVYMNKMGTVNLTGIGTDKLYFKGLLDAFGIKVHNIRSHPYKTAMNGFSEPEMTAEEREVLELFYSDIYESLLGFISSGRQGKLSAPIKELAARGPYFVSSQAVEAGLIDGVIYPDELTDKLTGFHKHPVITGGNFLPPYRKDWSEPYFQQIALIYAVGLIVPGQGIPGSTIGADSLSSAIRAARENPFVKAVVLRIDSGGGSSMASDIIAREVKLTTEAGKPVIVSIAGAGASGGYYIAAYADTIIASPVSITGSIGVYAAFPEFSGLLEKYGVRTDTVETAPNAGFFNPLTPFSEEQTARIKESVDYIYDLFLQTVADGRSMEKEKVNEYAQGRVWTGRQALERGLVDQLGGLFSAIETAAEKSGINGEYMLVDYSYRDVPFSMRMTETLSAPLQNMESLAQLQKLNRAAMIYSLMKSEGILLMEPLAEEE